MSMAMWLSTGTWATYKQTPTAVIFPHSSNIQDIVSFRHSVEPFPSHLPADDSVCCWFILNWSFFQRRHSYTILLFLFLEKLIFPSWLLCAFFMIVWYEILCSWLVQLRKAKGLIEEAVVQKKISKGLF